MSSSNCDSAGSELAADTILQNRYRIVRPLGKGGMGAVYEALDLRLDATVAIKEAFSTDDHLRKQFEREARMLANLHHPSLPRVSDYFTEGDRAFLVMQFIEGVDLAKIIVQQPGPFPLESVVAWADQLLDALIYLHSRDRQVIHRDIKPHNLKLTPEGQIALLDFGLAKAQGRHAGGGTSSAAIFGYTRQYAPLEQIQDLATGPQSDIYALGATLYHLLTGVKPPDALTRAAALVQSRPDPLRPANEVHAAIGPEIAAILTRAMAQSPDDRYASAADFRNALRQVGRTGTVCHTQLKDEDTALNKTPQSPGDTPVLSNESIVETERFGLLPENTRKRSYRTRTLAGVGILLFAGVVTALFLSQSRTNDSPVVNTSNSNADSAQLPGTSTRASKLSRSNPLKSEIGSNNLLVVPSNSLADDSPKERVTAGTPAVIASSLSQVSGGDLTRSQRMARMQGEALRSLKAPDIHLPMPIVQKNYPTAIPTRSPGSEQYPSNYATPTDALSPAPAVEILEPQILRARDGTQIVKFPDGTTRVFRPGEGSPRANNPRQ
ncbi:MAG TPA: serine/threonine-protein kinase [Pyrinomonadaceae bacterium]|nr:serine/threonine-protein kinase [Pyrinomonadaceae bacterium]